LLIRDYRDGDGDGDGDQEEKVYVVVPEIACYNFKRKENIHRVYRHRQQYIEKKDKLLYSVPQT
jgi:hypothetical protein